MEPATATRYSRTTGAMQETSKGANCPDPQEGRKSTVSPAQSTKRPGLY
jgi:hypothetical protein